ncbi:hypothetical protein Tco_1031463 [Tanacetum coccineum]|uniref:Uncharacterized protein n=1 Tax=Tanacetum coccineum TaxID=301880 RepID=A0ABQ5GB19_9ASTR
MMTYLKHVGNYQHSQLKTKKFKEIQTLYEKIKRSDEDFITIGSAEDERMIKEMNEKGIDSSKSESVKEEGKEEEEHMSDSYVWFADLMSMWIISRGAVLLILLMEYKTIKILMEDMLPLEETSKEGKPQEKV